LVFWLITHVVCWVLSNKSEERTASILVVAECGIGMLLWLVHATWCHNPENHNMNLQCCDNLESHLHASLSKCSHMKCHFGALSSCVSVLMLVPVRSHAHKL
jgi:hypothetical protein